MTAASKAGDGRDASNGGRHGGTARRRRKPHYVKPQLRKHGDIRDVTVGGSPGMGESGAMYTTNEPIW